MPKLASPTTSAQTASHDVEAMSSASGQHGPLIDWMNEILAPLKLEVVAIEVQTHRARTLRVFIDHSGDEDEGVGIEDCASASRALDEPLDQSPWIESLFKGATYELEVSSPGIERPLRTERDFSRFAGSRVRIHTYRPLSAAELGNPDYATKNPKQKNFLGILKGIQDLKIQLSLVADDGLPRSSKGKKKSEPVKTLADVAIPLGLASKAHLDPIFELNKKENEL